MKLRISFLLILTLAGISGCGLRSQTESEARQELKTLASQAKTGTADQAVTLGEKALSMMSSQFSAEEILAQKITRQGEEEFVFSAFDESLEIFRTALSLDPQNEKALAYLGFLTPFIHARGLFWRTTSLQEERDYGTGIYFLLGWSGVEKNISNAIQIYLYAPNKTKFTNQGEAQVVFKEVADDLLSAAKFWELLKDKTNIDLILQLPQEMSASEAVRVRTEDTKTMYQLDMGLALYLKLYHLYHGSDRYIDDKAYKNDVDKMVKLVAEPGWGILQDPQFFARLQNNVVDLVQGTEMALGLLKQRLLRNENDRRDATQFSSAHESKCDLAMGCDESTFKEKSYITAWTTQNRDVFWNLDGSAQDPRTHSERNYREVYKNNIRGSDWSYEGMMKSMQDMEEMVVGPYEAKVWCLKGKQKDKHLKIWIDIPTYAKNPVTNLKDIMNAQYVNTASFLKDTTIHGLFPKGLETGMCNDWGGGDHPSH